MNKEEDKIDLENYLIYKTIYRIVFYIDIVANVLVHLNKDFIIKIVDLIEKHSKINKVIKVYVSINVGHVSNLLKKKNTKLNI